MNTIYIGVDFHARQQTICYLTIENGELQLHELKHQNKEEVRAFYAQFQGHVIVGLEASGYSPWFERLLEELGCEVWLGHATEIRRRARWRQKNDRRDAELIWTSCSMMNFHGCIYRHCKVAKCCACFVTARS
jgi:transposase